MTSFNKDIDLYKYEKQYSVLGYDLVAGVDEAGRGPLAGPLVVASVILDSKYTYKTLIYDSKQLNKKQREEAYIEILAHNISYNIQIVPPKVIDELNILVCTKKAMEDSIQALEVKPSIALIDYISLPNIDIKNIGITKGDTLSISIAAASILAKVTRDKIMEEYDMLYPEYGFKTNMGYPTKKHYAAIEKYGVLEIHRKTFRLK
ncbi:MAG: ribonuclease HII [Acholeplasmatales bacterium]|nr:ribonuclease HII [Acholeplasmatales bacterium]